MGNSNITIKVGFGRYNLLDKLYNRFINLSLKNTNEETIERWSTYEIIIAELIDLNKINYFEEIKYRLTDGETPNDIFIDIMERDSEIRTYLWPYLIRIKEYKNEDLLKRFYE